MRYLEAIGLSPILAAAGWELFLERPLVDVRQGADQYYLETKLDAIWGLVADTYSHSEYNRSEAVSNANFASLVEIYPWAGVEDKTISKQVSFVQNWRAVIFLLGSFFVVFPKFAQANATDD